MSSETTFVIYTVGSDVHMLFYWQLERGMEVLADSGRSFRTDRECLNDN